MMKYIQKFENYTDTPEIGDYIIMKIYAGNEKWRDYINNNIGQVVDIKNSYNYNGTYSHKSVVIRYKNIPENLKHIMSYNSNADEYTKKFMTHRIYAFAKTIEELKVRLTANKYNL